MFRKHWLYILLGTIALAGGFLYYTAQANAEGLGKPVSRAEAELLAPSKTWSGCFLSAHGGAAVMVTRAGLGVTGPFTGTVIELDGIAGSGYVYGAGLGCDVRLGTSPFVVGAFADYDRFGATDWNLNILPGTAAAATFRTALDNQWSIGGRAGYLPTASTLIYGLLAYSQLKMDAFSGAGSITGSLAMPTFHGYQIGGGVETLLGRGWSLKGEYRMGLYDGESVPIGTSGFNLAVDPTVHTVRAAVAYKFSTDR